MNRQRQIETLAKFCGFSYRIVQGGAVIVTHNSERFLFNPFMNVVDWYKLDCKLIDLGYQTEHLHLHSCCKSKIGKRGSRMADGDGLTIMESGSRATLQLIEHLANGKEGE